MRTFQLTLAALGVVASSAALAADLPSRRAPPVYAPPPPIPVFSWTGFYLGGNAGYAFGARRDNAYAIAPGGITDVNTGLGDGPGAESGVLSNFAGGGRNGFTGGGQIGYNYQLGAGGPLNGILGGLGGVVVGIEADAQYLGLRNGGGGTTNYAFAPTGGAILNNGAAFFPVPGVANPTLFVRRSRLDYYGTVRGRIGYAFDRFLVFGTGGFAYSNNGTGYAVGGGLEYALTNNITIRGEYQYVNLDRSRSATTGVYDAAANTVTLFANGGRENFNVVRGAINYKLDFGAPAIPVVARY